MPKGRSKEEKMYSEHHRQSMGTKPQGVWGETTIYSEKFAIYKKQTAYSKKINRQIKIFHH